MAISEKVREQVHGKYDGKCAYCGDPLVKGWHVDHIKPIQRMRKYEDAHYRHKVTKEKMNTAEAYKMFNAKADNRNEWEHRAGKWVYAGCLNPENDCIENYTPACASCNINKHGMDIEEFRKAIETFVASLNNYSVQYKIAKRFGLVKETQQPVTFYFEKIKQLQ